MIENRNHTVGILVFDGMKMLDLAGPAEVFSESNLDRPTYDVRILSVDGKPVTSSIGVTVTPDAAVDDAGRFDTVLVVGGDVFPRTPVSPDLVRAAQRLDASTGRMASICTGAFVLAAAGLLDEKRATTHWKHAAELASRYPKVRVEPDAIYVKDDSTYTSAGVTAGIDLTLALVEEDRGAEAARTIARSLVVYMQRAGGQSQFSAPLQGPSARSPVLRLITDAITAEPLADYSVAALAKRSRVSSRHLLRMFHEEMDTSPARYVQTIRLDIAKNLLDSGHSATDAAELSGFPSYESLRRAFTHHLGVSPTAYRGRFSGSGALESPDVPQELREPNRSSPPRTGAFQPAGITSTDA